MRIRTVLPALAVGLTLAACTVDTSLTNPNALDTGSFWHTQSDAIQGINATYNTLLRLGTFQRWQAFSYGIRSDIGTAALSPWTDLANFNKFTFVTYDFDINHDTWNDSYTTIFRANQVIANVPNIDMDAALRSRIVGEAKFLRGLMYFHLMTLYGGQIPLITQPSQPTDRVASSDSATVWAQIEKDFGDAAGALPAQYGDADVGRATSGAAEGMLGKTLLQERKWSAAAAELQPIIQSGRYALVPDYASNFTAAGKNNVESLFEVQMGNPTLAGSQGVGGLNISKMVGPCGPSYCDGRPTRWYFNQFFPDTTNRAVYDPRLDATLFWNNPAGEDVYGDTYANRYGAGSDLVFFKKWGEYYLPGGDQSWDASINYKVLRFADVLLMYAEALNEQGQTTQAYQWIDSVRTRAGVAPLAAGMTQAQMRDAILHERMMELGLEMSRWMDLGRQNLFADVATLKQHDPDFDFFVPGKSQLLPIPQAEINLNPNVKQNPGW